MGTALSLLRKAGLPGVESMASDKVYNDYFKDVKGFDEFHVAFIRLCNEINTALPGKHLKAPSEDKVKKWHDTWKGEQDAEKKKKELIKFISENVEEHQPNRTAMIVTGVAAPAGATFLKKTGENMPQLKPFRLHLIPNFVFVPTCTLLALAGVRALQIKPSSPA